MEGVCLEVLSTGSPALTPSRLYPGGRRTLRSDRFALGLGSNLGNRYVNICSAVESLAENRSTISFELSGMYQTEPWGTVRGRDFLNCTMTGQWTSGLAELRNVCLETELAAGSEPVKSGAARTLDIDVLFWEGELGESSDLILPHPRLHLRRFVLVPLAEVWIENVPGLGATPLELLADCPDSGHIIRVREKPVPGSFWS